MSICMDLDGGATSLTPPMNGWRQFGEKLIAGSDSRAGASCLRWAIGVTLPGTASGGLVVEHVAVCAERGGFEELFAAAEVFVADDLLR